MNGKKYDWRTETNQIIVHCTATKPKNKVTADQVREWHIDRGFLECGYHFIVDLDGSVTCTRPLLAVGAHCKGHNHDSVGIAYIGGLADGDGSPMDTRTSRQRFALEVLIRVLAQVFSIKEVWGHNHYDPRKACPCFDAHEEYKL